MYVLLPTETEGVSSLNRLEPKLNARIINQLIGQMVKKSVSVSLPKFRIENSVNLKVNLES
jgi:serine protease inhibitor